MKLRIVLAIAAMAIVGQVGAHEFWIEPSAHYTGAGDRVDIQLKVGENFRGSPQSYIPSEIQRFAQVSTTAETIDGLLGDSRPAASIVTRPGLNRIIHLTASSSIWFRSGDERWANYVELDGLAVQLGKYPDLPQMVPLVERYLRSAKSLIVTGDGTFADSSTGLLPFELVIDGSWNRLAIGDHRFTLLEAETGVPEILIKAFRHSDGEVVDQAYTDSLGQVILTLPSVDRYLVSGVVIRPDSSPDRDWVSHWPSLTLEVR